MEVFTLSPVQLTWFGILAFLVGIGLSACTVGIYRLMAYSRPHGGIITIAGGLLTVASLLIIMVLLLSFQS